MEIAGFSGDHRQQLREHVALADMELGEFSGLAVHLARRLLQQSLRFGARLMIHEFADGFEMVELGLRHCVEQSDGAAGAHHAPAGVA